MRLAAAGTFPHMLSAVCITHLHSDHVSALGDLITTNWVMSMGNATLSVYGPLGTAELVGRVLGVLKADIGYRIAHHESLTEEPRVEAVELYPDDTFEIGGVHVSVAATEHPPVRPTLGYRFEHGGSTAALVGDTLPCEGVDRLCASADVYVQTVIRRDIVGTDTEPDDPGHPRLPLRCGAGRTDRGPLWCRDPRDDPHGPCPATRCV